MPKKIRVVAGDCAISLASREGLTVDKLWEACGELAALGRKPHQLIPGDEVVIPDRTPKVDERATDRQHRYRRRDYPALCRLQLLVRDRALAGEPIVFVGPGEERVETRSDDQGVIELRLPPAIRRGRLLVGEPPVEHELVFGELQPISTTLGVQARLANLHFFDGALDGQPSEALERSLEDFRDHAGLPEDAAPESVRDALERHHDRLE